MWPPALGARSLWSWQRTPAFTLASTPSPLGTLRLQMYGVRNIKKFKVIVESGYAASPSDGNPSFTTRRYGTDELARREWCSPRARGTKFNIHPPTTAL
jgi:hypothetical protein